MFAKLLVLFTVVPLIELYLLITLGQIVGAEITVGVVFITGLLGATLAKREGTRVLREWQDAVSKGLMPKEGVTSSLLVLVGGILLITPGVLTDVVGLSLLIPPSRRLIAGMLKGYVQKRFEIQTVGPGLAAGFAREAARSSGEVIDVDGHDHDPPRANETASA